MSGDGFPNVEWIAAHADRFTVRNSRTIDEIVLHITEGGTADARVTARNALAIPQYYQNGVLKNQSAHYIVGRDGTVVQCVRHKDIAHHASSANAYTIGIEHNTRAGADTTLTDKQYLRSAELVVWLGRRLNILMNRYFITGHSEADPHTTHSSCPQRVLNWETYMQAIDHVQAVAEGRTPMRLWN